MRNSVEWGFLCGILWAIMLAGRLLQAGGEGAWKFESILPIVHPSVRSTCSDSAARLPTLESAHGILVQKPRLLVGRVLLDEKPVEGATLQLHYLDRGNPVDVERVVGKYPVPQKTLSDSGGRFRISATGPGRVEIRAWHEEFGLGHSAALELDAAHPPSELRILIDQAPGGIAGKVLFPPGHVPGELYITCSGKQGLFLVAEDGSYAISNVMPGSQRIRFLNRGGGFLEQPYPKNAENLNSHSGLMMSHPPHNGPKWLMPDVSFRADVQAGAIVVQNIDLNHSQRCVLEGRILLDGKAPLLIPLDVGPFSMSSYRISLGRNRYSDFVCDARLDADGRFRLETDSPGAYLLRIRLPTGKGLDWKIYDRAELRPGTQAWKLELDTGSVLIKSLAKEEKLKVSQSRLIWKGQGNLRIFPDRPDRAKGSQSNFYPCVPVGSVQYCNDPGDGRRIVLSQGSVQKGESTTLE